MKKILSLCLMFFCFAIAFANAKSDELPLNYEIKAAGVGQTGYYIVEVSTYVKGKSKININELKKCAVHGVLFRGFSGDLSKGTTSQKPILSQTAEAQHADFFKQFFDNGNYLSYATEVNPNINAIKVGKQYKITAVIQVAKEQLRKDLQSAGIVKKLGL